MKKQCYLSVILFLLTTVAFFSCKKKSNDNPFANARIATIDMAHAGAIQHYRIVYDASNNVDSMVITGGGTASGSNGYLKFGYIGSSYTITDQNNFSFLVYANTAGEILKINVADTQTFTYNGSQLSQVTQYLTTITPPYYTNTPTYFAWQNGDLATSRTGNITTTYTYNTGKNGQPGDGIRINEFLRLGRSYIKTTHLPVSMAAKSTQGFNYTYTFDGSGRISTLISENYDTSIPLHDTTTFAYTYY